MCTHPASSTDATDVTVLATHVDELSRGRNRSRLIPRGRFIPANVPHPNEAVLAARHHHESARHPSVRLGAAGRMWIRSTQCYTANCSSMRQHNWDCV
eukprot:6203748-Pleurochrysis_carterae.AAC.4